MLISEEGKIKNMASGKTDYYDILGVNKTASQDEIKKAYRKQALEWHPDRHKDNKEAAEKRFKEINEAYQILSDTKKRSSYDQFGHAAFAPGGGTASGNPFAGGNPFGGFQYTYSTSGQNPSGNFDFGDPFDIFEQFFGGNMRQNRKPRYSMSISFDEAMKGVTKKVTIEGKKRTVKIPKGVDDGTRIDFNDFILSTNVAPSKIFERDGADIYVTVKIPYSLALLGGEVSVPTIEGDVKIKIRSSTQGGSYVRLKGKGAPFVQRNDRGDHYVKFEILVPEKLSREARSMANDMKKAGL